MDIQIPMYIISNAGMQKNGENPVILNGYGGFNVAGEWTRIDFIFC